MQDLKREYKELRYARLRRKRSARTFRNEYKRMLSALEASTLDRLEKERLKLDFIRDLLT
jgi:hypothetical protein